MAAISPEVMLVAVITTMFLGAESVPFYGAAIQTDGHRAWRTFNDWPRDYGSTDNGMRLTHGIPVSRRGLGIFQGGPFRPQDGKYTSEENMVRDYVIQALIETNDTTYKEDRAQEKILNKNITCSDEQKACLRYNRLHIPNQKGCFHLHWKSDKCTVYADEAHIKNNALNFLQGKCKNTSDKNGTCDNTVRSFLNQIFYGVICPVKVCSEGENCQQLQFVEQPDESGLCIFPDFRIDVLRMTTNTTFKVPVLSRVQAKCNAEGKVWRKRNGSCYPLLERGPCSEDQILVLSKQKYSEGNIVTSCIFEQCKIGEKLMAFDGKCHKDVEAALMPGERLFMNWFGEWYAAPEVGTQQVVKEVQYLPGE